MNDQEFAEALAGLIERRFVDVELDEAAQDGEAVRVWPRDVAPQYAELEPLDPRD